MGAGAVSDTDPNIAKAIAIARARAQSQAEANPSIGEDLKKTAVSAPLQGIGKFMEQFNPVSGARQVLGDVERMMGGTYDVSKQQEPPVDSVASKLPSFKFTDVPAQLFGETANYDPKTPEGKIIGGGLEAAPMGLLAGPMGALKAVPTLFGSGAASEIGGLLTEDKPYEPIARLAAGLLGGLPGIVSPGRKEIVAGKMAKSGITKGDKSVMQQLRPTGGAPYKLPPRGQTIDGQDLTNMRTFMYKSLKDAGITYDPGEWGQLGVKMWKRLVDAHMRPDNTNEAEAFRLVQDISRGAVPDFADLERRSQKLGDDIGQAYRADNQQLAKALTVVHDALDEFAIDGKFTSPGGITPRQLAQARAQARDLGLRGIKERRLRSALERADDHRNGDFVGGLRIALDRIIHGQEGKRLFSKPERDLLKAVRDGNKPINTLAKWGLDFKSPTGGMGQLFSRAVAGGGTYYVGQGLGHPALGALGAGALGLGVGAGTIVKGLGLPDKLARGGMATAMDAIRSGRYPQAVDRIKRMAERRRTRRALVGINSGVQAMPEPDGNGGYITKTPRG
jgi:hypothetical protein